MGDIKGWVTGICLSLLAAGIVRMVAPKGAAGKTMNMVISLFILCVICVPFARGIDLSFEFPEKELSSSDIAGISQSVSNFRKSEASKKIKEQIEIILAQYEIKTGKISISMDTLEDNSIFISEIIIYIPEAKAELSAEVGRTIKTQLGLDTLILTY